MTKPSKKEQLSPTFSVIDGAPSCQICKHEVLPTWDDMVYGLVDRKDKRFLSYVVMHRKCWLDSLAKMGPVYMISNVVA